MKEGDRLACFGSPQASEQAPSNRRLTSRASGELGCSNAAAASPRQKSATGASGTGGNSRLAVRSRLFDLHALGPAQMNIRLAVDRKVGAGHERTGLRTAQEASVVVASTVGRAGEVLLQVGDAGGFTFNEFGGSAAGGLFG